MQSMHKLGIVLCLLLTVMSTSCKKDEVTEDMIPVEEEVITTLTYTLSPVGGGDDVVLQSRDLDGEGGEDAVVTVSGPFAANSAYTGSLILLNETEDPAEEVNEEIEDADEEHQFFYIVEDANLSVSYSDMDSNGNPVGLESSLITTSASAGTLTVVLRHEPDKDAEGVANGHITNAGGETDIEVTFDVEIQ